MRNKDVIEFLGLWEKLNYEGFKPVEFDGLKNSARANAFTLSPNLAVMVVLLHIRILLLNLLLDFNRV